MRIFRNPWLKLLFILLFFIGISLALRYLNINFSQVTLEAFKNKINSLGIWGPIAYIIFYLLRPLVLFPAAILSASSGVIWGLKGLIYLLIAANISANAEFFIARYFARQAMERLIKGKISNLDERIERHGFLTVLLVRLIPNVAWDIQNLALGITNVKFRDFFFATLIGIIPGSFALVYFGASVINVLTNPKNFWMIIAAILIFAGIYMVQRYLKKTKPIK